MLKEKWRQRWLSSINELTSLELQKIAWIDGDNTNQHWSFVEFICCYFDDLVIDDNYKSQLDMNLITKTEYRIVIDWHLKLDKYKPPNNDDYDVVSILNDRNWIQVVDLGVKMKEKLMNQLTENEKEILAEIIDYTKYRTVRSENDR